MHPAYSGFSPNLPYQWSYIKILNLQRKNTEWISTINLSSLADYLIFRGPIPKYRLKIWDII